MFTQWLENRKELAKQYSGMLKNVPQDPHHHPEGDVITHVRLVRKAIPRAIEELKKLQEDKVFGNALDNIDFNVSQEESKILYILSFLHDIGKNTATTITTG